MINIEWARLSIDGGPTTYTISVANFPVESVRAALLAGNARALYAVNSEFAPFWRPSCQCCNCEEHYAREAVFDEFSYDCTYGTCLHGHRRMLCD